MASRNFANDVAHSSSTVLPLWTYHDTQPQNDGQQREAVAEIFRIVQELCEAGELLRALDHAERWLHAFPNLAEIDALERAAEWLAVGFSNPAPVAVAVFADLTPSAAVSLLARVGATPDDTCTMNNPQFEHRFGMSWREILLSQMGTLDAR